PRARAAVARNATANGVAFAIAADLEEALAAAPDLLLAGDVCYEAEVAGALLALAARGAAAPEILVADPGRRGLALPPAHLEPIAALRARTFPELDEPTEGAAVYRLRAAPAALREDATICE